MAEQGTKAMDLNQAMGELEGVQRLAAEDMPSFVVSADRLRACCKHLRDACGFDMLLDVTAVDEGEGAAPRFYGVYHFYNTGTHSYARIRTACVSAAKPTLPSLTALWPAANWHEREAFDMFGIRYEDHPDLRRILMWESFEHFPLRKEFPLAGAAGELPAKDVADISGAKVQAAPMLGGPFRAPQGSALSQREPHGLNESWDEGGQSGFLKSPPSPEKTPARPQVDASQADEKTQARPPMDASPANQQMSSPPTSEPTNPEQARPPTNSEQVPESMDASQADEKTQARPPMDASQVDQQMSSPRTSEPTNSEQVPESMDASQADEKTQARPPMAASPTSEPMDASESSEDSAVSSASNQTPMPMDASESPEGSVQAREAKSNTESSAPKGDAS